MPVYDAVVVGSEPNGLAAAVELARAGRSVFIHGDGSHTRTAAPPGIIGTAGGPTEDPMQAHLEALLLCQV